MTQSKKKNAVPEPTDVHALTFQRHPLFTIFDEDPDGHRRLEILLRPDGVRIAVYPDWQEADARVLIANVSAADFAVFIEYGRAHVFESPESNQNSPPDPPTFSESWLLQIASDPLDLHNYVEICVRPDGVSFTVTASDHEGLVREQMVRISSVDFKTLIDSVDRHKTPQGGHK